MGLLLCMIGGGMVGWGCASDSKSRLWPCIIGIAGSGIAILGGAMGR